MEHALTTARSAELELEELRDKFGSLCVGADKAKEGKEVAEKEASEARLELTELREKCGSLCVVADTAEEGKEYAEREASEAKAAKCRADAGLEALRAQIGAKGHPQLFVFFVVQC